jgi:hypothetical protein
MFRTNHILGFFHGTSVGAVSLKAMSQVLAEADTQAMIFCFII